MNKREIIYNLENINKKVTELLDELCQEEQPPTAIDLTSGDLTVFMGVKSILEKYSMPIDDEFIKCVIKLLVSEDISTLDLEKVLDRVLYASKTQDIKDMRKYVYSCLHKYNNTRNKTA